VAAVIARTPVLHPFLTPIPLAAILVTLLVDDLVGMMVVAWLAALVGTVTGWGMSVTLVGFVGGIAAIYSVRDVTHRLEVYRSMLLVAVAMTAAVAGVMLVGPIVPWSTLWQEVVWAVGNAVLCTATAVLILPVFEKIFDRVTNITLLELSDLNRPIFKRMMVEANGTYHHSLVIGSLSEAAAEAIGANPLLARVGAYYHDIGKIAKSTYFGENMRKGSRNPHERLTPTMSSLILESHVREGLELAREIGLPGQVAAFIPEHQGTTLMQYFYNKALELDPEVEERDYRYPGPRPRTKETAIVMLGDAAEATVRSLDEQSPQRIRAVLDRIFELRTSDGQLDECGVTVSDLAKIREAFTHVLSGVFHGRVKYQWQKDGGEEQLGAAAAERVFHPELETGLGTETIPGSRSYAAVSQAPGKTTEG
jgi:putative nucleotidyltransferase with HDIG domain